jgi:hypothetical protein
MQIDKLASGCEAGIEPHRVRPQMVARRPVDFDSFRRDDFGLSGPGTGYGAAASTLIRWMVSVIGPEPGGSIHVAGSDTKGESPQLYAPQEL